jgi:hypothetical protein
MAPAFIGRARHSVRAVFVNPTWHAEDCGRYRENNEGPAVAREALAQLAIFYVSVVTGTTDRSFGR